MQCNSIREFSYTKLILTIEILFITFASFIISSYDLIFFTRDIFNQSYFSVLLNSSKKYKNSMATITFKGNEIHTQGSLPEVGSTLKDFTLIGQDLSEKKLSDFDGKKKIFNIFPGIDTGVCAASARTFNVEAGNLENTVVINVSKDLPFALGRFCAAEGLDHVETLSDFRGNFGEQYGVIISDGPLQGLLSRAVVVADENNTIVYEEQVPEIAQEPNYEAALSALK